MAIAPLTLDDYRGAVRQFLRDNAEINRLLKFEEENPNDNLDLYINLALGFLNALPPLLQMYDYGTFPMPVLLVHQAVIEALISNNILHARNELTYNNGGITVKISDKERYLPLINMLTRLTDLYLKAYKQLKVSMNIDAGWGGVPSPYAWWFGNYSLKPNYIL